MPRPIRGHQVCLALVLLVVLGLVACSPSSNTPVPTAAPPPESTSAAAGPTPETVTIEMINTSFQPATVQIPVGTTVTWVNKDPLEHSTTSDSGLWDSGLLAQGGTFSFTFTQAGTFPYHCTPHQALGMTGTITVVP